MHVLLSARSPRVRLVPRPKPGGVRLICILDPTTDAAYARAVAAVVGAVERSLGPQVIANRVERVSFVPPAITLRSWKAERRAFGSAVAALPSAGPRLRTDVTACYPSISPGSAGDALARCGAEGADVERCVRLLDELATEGVEGLPIGPAASAVLANAVLAGGDLALRDAGEAFVRWVDDWWISVRSQAHAAHVLHRLGDALATAGLRLNADKTGIGPPPAADGGLSPVGAQYHRAADAHAVPGLPRPHALVPGDGGVAAGGRAPRPARR